MASRIEALVLSIAGSVRYRPTGGIKGSYRIDLHGRTLIVDPRNDYLNDFDTLLAPDGRPLALPLDWYEWPIALRFHARIRGMVRFDGLDALLAAMEGDRAAVLAALRR